MNVKFSLRLLLLIALIATILLPSCGSQNEVVSYHVFQKRKHRPGYHVNLGHSKKSHTQDTKRLDTQSKQERTLVQADAKPPLHKRLADKIALRPMKLFSDSWRSSFAEVRALHKEKKDRVMALLPVDHGEITTLDEPETGTEEDPEEMRQKGTISLVAGILAWFLSGLAIITNLIIPPVGLVFSGLALVAAILAVVFGGMSKRDNDMGLVGFVLGLIYLILAAIALLIVILIIVFIILALASW